MSWRLPMSPLEPSPLHLHKSTHLLAFEWAGCILGLVGAFLLATHSTLSAYGWFAFLAANLAMIAFASGIQARGCCFSKSASSPPLVWGFIALGGDAQG
jgi:hypothetical protein